MSFKEYNGKNYGVVEINRDGEWKVAGSVADRFMQYFKPGQIKRVKIYTTKYETVKKPSGIKVRQPKNAVLLSLDLTQQEIEKILLFDYSKNITGRNFIED